MAGIGFELRELLSATASGGWCAPTPTPGSSAPGPWVLSILGVMGIGVLSVGPVAAVEVRQFLVSVTYLMAGSLILTGALQLTFTRFIADRLFDKDERSVLPNLLGRADAVDRRGRRARRRWGSLLLPRDAWAGTAAGASSIASLLVATLACCPAAGSPWCCCRGSRSTARVMGSFLAGYFVSFVGGAGAAAVRAGGAARRASWPARSCCCS